jgi:hypothetical protein
MKSYDTIMRRMSAVKKLERRRSAVPKILSDTAPETLADLRNGDDALYFKR